MWCQMKKIAVSSFKNQDILHEIALTSSAMSTTNMVTLSWTAHTEYLLQELQQHITNHTRVIMPDQVWGTTMKIETDKANPDHSLIFRRHCSLSHHNSCRGHSRSQHRDRCSHHHRSSLWWSCSTHRGHSHRPHHDAPHCSHCRSFQNPSSSGYQSWDHSRSHSPPSYRSSRHESHQSDSYSSRTTRRPHPKKNMKGEDWRPTHWLLQLWWPLQQLRRGLRSFKLIEPSPSSDSHEQGGLPSNDQVTVALIMDCPTITVHAGKCYKALIDSGAAISLIRYSTYQTIDSSFKTPIQTTTTKLNTADGLPMMALGITALHLRIAWISNSLIILLYMQQATRHRNTVWNWYPEKRFPCHLPGIRKRTATYRRMAGFLTYTWNCEQKATIGIVKSTLKIPPRHNGIIPIKTKGQTIKGHMAYFISNQDSTKGKMIQISTS